MHHVRRSSGLARLLLIVGLCALGFASCAGGEVILSSADAAEVAELAEVTETTSDVDTSSYIDIDIGPIATLEELAALRGSAWIVYPNSDPPSYGGVSFAWQRDRLVGSFSDQCGAGGFEIVSLTADGWEVLQTSIGVDAGCNSALGSIFGNGVRIRFVKTETGLFVEAPNIGFFDAVHWQSTSVHDDPLAPDVSETDIDPQRVEPRPIETTTTDPNGPNANLIGPADRSPVTTIVTATTIPASNLFDLLHCVQDGNEPEQRRLEASEDGFGATVAAALEEFEGNFEPFETRPGLLLSEPEVIEIDGDPTLAIAIYTDDLDRRALLVELVLGGAEWETTAITLCAP